MVDTRHVGGARSWSAGYGQALLNPHQANIFDYLNYEAVCETKPNWSSSFFRHESLDMQAWNEKWAQSWHISISILGATQQMSKNLMGRIPGSRRLTFFKSVVFMSDYQWEHVEGN